MRRFNGNPCPFPHSRLTVAGFVSAAIRSFRILHRRGFTHNSCLFASFSPRFRTGPLPLLSLSLALLPLLPLELPPTLNQSIWDHVMRMAQCSPGNPAHALLLASYPQATSGALTALLNGNLFNAVRFILTCGRNAQYVLGRLPRLSELCDAMHSDRRVLETVRDHIPYVFEHDQNASSSVEDQVDTLESAADTLDSFSYQDVCGTFDSRRGGVSRTSFCANALTMLETRSILAHNSHRMEGMKNAAIRYPSSARAHERKRDMVHSFIAARDACLFGFTAVHHPDESGTFGEPKPHIVHHRIGCAYGTSELERIHDEWVASKRDTAEAFQCTGNLAFRERVGQEDSCLDRLTCHIRRMSMSEPYQSNQ